MRSDDIAGILITTLLLSLLGILGGGLYAEHQKEMKLIDKGYVHYDGWFLPKEK
jgi:hypothetical protein